MQSKRAPEFSAYVRPCYAGVALNVVIYSALFYLLGILLIGLGRLVRLRAQSGSI
jgi:hypothetical protein